jgi:bacillithiol system protein YtxJ
LPFVLDSHFGKWMPIFAAKEKLAMGFFNKLFDSDSSANNSSNRIQWASLTSVLQLEELKEISKLKKVLIFKHSTRCGISRMVLKQFESDYRVDGDNVAFYYLDLIAHRDVSNAIADQFGVTHQSPQLLVLENGVCTKHASHYGINDLL